MQPIRTAKLTEADVLGMRKRVLVDQVSTVKMEADRFGIARETVRRALRGETFRAVGNLAMEVPETHEVGPGEDEAEASLNRVLEAQKGRVLTAREQQLLAERGLAGLVLPEEGEGKTVNPINPLEES